MTDAAVGIVVVSHSRALAQAAIALAGEMVRDHAVRMEEAAGLEDGAFGTDAVRIADAIVRADAGRGVVVLMDLGSAVLSAEVALDVLELEMRARVTLCPAPLVEGLCVAAVAAAGGAAREEVAAEARRSLAAKEEHLDAGREDADEGQPDGGSRDVTGRFEVSWRHGLHARPAAVLVRAVHELDADVRLRNVTIGGEAVPAGSLSRVAALGAEQGHIVEVIARGPDAESAVERLLALALEGFGDVAGPPPSAPEAAQAGRPLPGSPGAGVGPAWLPVRPPPSDESSPAGDPDAEWARLRSAMAAAETDIRRTRDRAAAVAGEQEAGVFDAHLLLLRDPDLLERARAGIDRGLGAIAAWGGAVDGAAGALAALRDVYQRARAADVRAVGDQVAAHLGSRTVVTFPAVSDADPGGRVLVVDDLTPADAAALDPRGVAAVVLARGSPTAHSVILLRALGIPAVVAAGPGVLDIAPGQVVAVDGTRGEVVVEPSEEVRAAVEQRADVALRRRASARAGAAVPAVTRNGVEILVGANLASLDDAVAAASAGADLAGLVRTELLFLDRTTAPSTEEQAEAYRALADALPGRRIVIRTLDAGGDKPLPYLPMPTEVNPFLGVRGIRLSLRRPELLRDQLRAIVRVAREKPIDVLFPLVSTVAELLAARKVLTDAARLEGGAVPAGLRLGIMVEVPATALKAAAFAPHVDFLSIGTNDLTQYALAAERGNDGVAAVADPLDPGVVALIAAAARAETTVAVCGELAADELATGLLVGLGVRELSVVPAAVPAVKQAVRQVDSAAGAELAAAVLAAPDAARVRTLLEGAGT
jgi:phosphoenolpyruvate-protein phosphotransferase/dihydroxyacetone kinase phosphotransfer subunit